MLVLPPLCIPNKFALTNYASLQLLPYHISILCLEIRRRPPMYSWEGQYIKLVIMKVHVEYAVFFATYVTQIIFGGRLLCYIISVFSKKFVMKLRNFRS